MIRRLASLVTATILLTVLATLPASAHVRVSSNDATQGGYGLLTFRVPTESDTASTIELIITMPTDTPITSVSTQPVPGWTAEQRVEKLAEPVPTEHGEITDYVATITWRADSAEAEIKPGEFQQFSISAGPLPEADSLSFPTEQRYSDGSTVSWDEIASGAEEPEHPAPTLTLRPATDALTATSAEPAAPEPTTGDGSSFHALDGVAIGLATVAVLLACIAILRTRRA